MLRIVASLLAEGVAQDRLTDRTTAFNMLENVFAPSFPALLGKLVVINIYENDDNKEPYWEKVSILDTEGNELSKIILPLDLQGHTHKSIGLFLGLKLAKPGTYKIVVDGATHKDGPWQCVAIRKLYVSAQAHPLDINPNTKTIPKATTLTD